MKSFEISDRKVLGYLYEKNEIFISWLEVIVALDWEDVGYKNYKEATKQIENLRQQNADILEALTSGEDDEL